MSDTPVAAEPLISIIIPAYNYAQLLPRVLSSVLAQWAEDIELLVVNDGSRDNTAEVLATYQLAQQAHHPQLQVVHQANAGAAAARNHGIRLARGRYALLLDADDELLPTALDTLREVVTSNPQAGLVLGAQLSVSTDGRERLRLPTPASGTPRQLIQRYLLDKKISISHCCTLFRRDLLLQRPYPESLRSGEDIAVFAYLLVSAPVALTNQPLARIYKHADSLRHNRADEEAVAQGMLREVFASLPAECQPLRQRYEAQRYLSLFRAALLDGDQACARRYYRHALRLSPLQALRWSYLKKALRLGLGLA
ncbi:MAG: glycosyltransferase family 2 protein [Pseudomonas sp.]|uniref:glycosyltransferase family 2 protein n=1 Tax=Pseudomonas sp. TaxID=306 RepID=UPI0027329826|nr:glycosyltransferase family 2 protein [Pseudomonas sp.]MDP3845679.1 glycosyltransferase family 2 protein [Pseudomonas sp.]